MARGKITIVFKKTTVGLNIGNSSIKVVELARTGEEIELLQFGMKDFNRAGGDEAIVSSLKTLFAERQISSPIVNTSVAGQDVVVRYIYMPKMTKAELKSAVKYEAEKYIPHKIDDMILDFQILNPEANAAKMRIVLVAAKKDYIERHIRILRDAGLSPKVIDVDSFAILNIFQLMQFTENQTIAVMDIGSKITNIIIAGEHNLYLTRDVFIAGDDIRHILSMKLGLTPEELNAEAVDISYDKLFGSIKTVVDNLVNEVRISFNFCEHQLESPIKTIFLTGGASMLKCLNLYLAAALGMEVKLWNLFAKIAIKHELPQEKINSLSSSLAVALGLAIRG
ncbi:MAG: type IV pilus assembly protein PilM [Candidatus Omnitrophota bacterium]